MRGFLLTLILGVFLISFVSAFSFDTTADYIQDETTSEYGKYLMYEKDFLFFKGDLKYEAELNDNTANCGGGDICYAYFNSTLLKEGTLVDTFNIYNKDTMESDTMRWYKLEYYGDVLDYETQCSVNGFTENGTEIQTCEVVQVGSHKGWVQFSEGQTFPVGDYEWRATGDKAPWKNIEWTFTKDGIETTAWSTWGAVGGANSWVNLTSPSDGSIAYSNPVSFTANASVYGGATLTNMSLYTNTSGSWALRNTTLLTAANLSFNLTRGSISTESSPLYAGLSFNVSTATTISSVKKSSASTANTAYLYVASDADSGNQLASAAFVGDYAYFNYALNTSATYFVIAGDSGGGSYTRTFSSSAVSYPQNNSIVRVNGFIILDSGGLQTNNFRNIEMINVSTAVASSSQSWNLTIPSGTTLWNVRACDSDGACGFGTSNYTVSLDPTVPAVILNYPTALVNYGAFNGTMQLNFTVTDTNLASVWYDYNGTNVTMTGATSGVANLSNITLTTKKNVTIYANDTAGNLNATTFSWDYRVFENSRTYNTSSYETSYESYSINVTANSSLTGVSINYNGTQYAMTNTADGIWTYARDLPSSTVGTNTFYYNYSYGGTNFVSDNFTQVVSPITLVLCNATFNTPFINFTFKDENTLASLPNVTMQTASWDYYLGTGTVNKSYVYTTSGINSSYAFCFGPANKTLYAVPSITYLATNYPARFYTPNILTLTNATTNTTLYLLNSADGIYVTFGVVSQASVAISGALITITRVISGSTVTLAEGTTDSAGAYTVWLNPNYDHTVVASKSGYGSNTQTIKPTQSSYTLTLTSGANYSYISNVNGLLWSYFPRERLNTTSTNFGFNVSSIYGNIIKCKIELLNNNKTVLLASGETIATNSSYCSVETTYTPSSSYPKVKGRLLVDIGEGYQVLEEDAYWALLSYNATGLTFMDWFEGLTSADLSYFNNDEQHREYTNILIFFLIVMIICASLNSAGWDIQTQGGMIFLVGALVWIASVPGFLNLSGISPYLIIDKYFVAVVYSMFMIGFGARSLQ